MEMISQSSAVDQLKQDVRYAWRQMVASPGFAIVAVLTLGLGIGANTAIFSIVDSILLTPLPYPDSERLVRVVENLPAEEKGLEYGDDLIILCNPFPILDRHLSIVHREHYVR